MESRRAKRGAGGKIKTPINKFYLVSRIIGVVLTLVMIAVFAVIIYLKVLPNKFLIPLLVIATGVDILGLVKLFKNKIKVKTRVAFTIICSIFIIVFSFIGLKLVKTLGFLNEMTTETVNSKKYSVLVLNESKYTKIDNLQYKMLLYYENELENNNDAIKKLTDAITLVTEKTDDVHELAEKLISKATDAILIEDSYYPIIEERVPDFKTKAKEIYTFTMEDTIATIAKEVSVTREPFNIYISGIDSYGKISSVARSDVNMVVSVNPQTKQILLINVPRDYYVQLNGTSGSRDKLTHAGIYGIDKSVKTIEDLFKTDINYYVRVNFTSLIKIIDAIGGVDVYSKYAFTSKIGNYKFKVGYNKLNGKKALGFARERYSFAEGDRMRGQNQQAVIDAAIKKICSSSTILTRFDSILDSLKGSFQTNMSYSKMIELVRMQIADNVQWNISSISVDGMGSSERTYSMGKTLLYVMIPYSGSVNKASSMIKNVLKGEMLEKGNIDLSSYNDFPVVPRGKYETTKKPTKTEEKKSEEPKEPETPTDPIVPVEPEVPTEPETPKEPETPTDPIVPVEPETPKEPETPTDPIVPVEPQTPTEPETPADS